MTPRFLILETSCFVGQVGLSRGEELLGVRRLEESRRQARDLVPAIGELVQAQGWKVRELDGVIVSRGPGSYTGLRVGIMTAKTLAYATGCALLAIDTFAAIARQAPAQAGRIDVLADAQREQVYVQEFGRTPAGPKMKSLTPLRIQKLADWLATLEEGTWVSGPGLQGKEDRLTDRLLVEPALRWPSPESLLSLGLERWRRGERDDFWKLEPLYLRVSAAEEQWAEKKQLPLK